MDKADFIKGINGKRKTGQWYSFIGSVEGKTVRLKGYKTWLQVYTVNDIDYSGCMDISVKEFNSILAGAV